MPFQSEKQRRYMHANLPDIAKRWEKEYATGGISNLFKNRTGFHRGSLRHQKEHDYKSYEDEGSFMKYLKLSGDRAKMSSPENVINRLFNLSTEEPAREDFETMMKERFMYGEHKPPSNFEQVWSDIKKLLDKKRNKHATGGVSNLFKLKEGGNIRLQPHTASDLLVQETSTGERPKYQPPGHVDAPAPSSSGGNGDEPSWGGGGYDAPSDPAPTTDDKGGGTTDDAYFNQQVDLPITTDDKGGVYKDQIMLIAEQEKKTREKREQASKEGFHQFLTAKAPSKKKSGFWGMLGKGILTLATAGAGAGVFGKDIMKVASLYNKYQQGKRIKTALDKGIKKLDINLSNVKNKLKSSDQKLMESLPKGHPERIALEAQMKVRTPPIDDRDGSSIKIEEIETVNKANAEKTQLEQKYREMDQAAYAAWLRQRQQQLELENKRQAWLKQLMTPYMSAQGGRVPGGYNTGGLSNLFRLKNV